MPEPQEHSIKVERTARYYTLGDESRKTEELWFVLHGYSNLARTFIDWFSPIAHDAFIVAPEGLSRFYPNSFSGKVGASWMTKEDRLNEIADYIAYLNLLYKRIVGSQKPKKLIVLGFSQGGPAALRWTANGAIEPDHVLIWSGDAPRDLDFESYKTTSASLHTWMVYGDNDPVLEQAIYEESEMLLRTHGIPFETIRFERGHEISNEDIIRIRAKIISERSIPSKEEPR